MVEVVGIVLNANENVNSVLYEIFFYVLTFKPEPKKISIKNLKNST